MPTVLAVVLLCPATASPPLSAAESEFHFVGPSSRPQSRPANEMRTFGAGPPIDWQPILRVAAQWQEQLSQLQWAFQDTDPAAESGPQLPAFVEGGQEENSADDEEIAAGSPEQDPCHMTSSISSLRVDIAAPEGMFPENVAARCAATVPPVTDSRMVGGWAVYEKHWSATCLCHRPLYFEEVNAERYGYTTSYVFQPYISGARFLVTIPALPYLMVARPACRCIYTLGHYRPGSCVPRRWHRTPLHIGAGVFEAAVVVGLVALIP